MKADVAVVCPVPPPAMPMVGRSALTSERKVGFPLAPLGAARKVLAV